MRQDGLGHELVEHRACRGQESRDEVEGAHSLARELCQKSLRRAVIALALRSEAECVPSLGAAEFNYALGQAFWLTDDERFAQELMNQWVSWVDGNPVLQTCNWGNAMEAAIRAANWCVAFSLTRDSAAQTPQLRERFLRSALDHGRFVAANLERFEGSPTSNHYLSDLVGLVYLGALIATREIGVTEWRLLRRIAGR